MTKVLLFLAATLCAATAQAQEPRGRSIAATCANCHGTDGHSVTTEVASLAGMPKEQIVQRMNEFKEGKRPATVMRQLAQGYTDAQIDAVASYLAAQAK